MFPRDIIYCVSAFLNPIDVICLLRTNKEHHKYETEIIPKLFKNNFLRSINNIDKNNILKYAKKNGCVFFGSSVYSLFQTNNIISSETDVDMMAYKNNIYLDNIYQSDELWPLSIGYCRIKSQTSNYQTNTNTVKLFKSKVMQIVTYNYAWMDYVLMEDSNCTTISDSIRLSVNNILNSYDTTVSACALWFDANEKMHVQIKSLSTYIKKSAHLNYVIDNTIAIGMIYTLIWNQGYNYEEMKVSIPVFYDRFFKRLEKYISLGYSITNDHVNYNFDEMYKNISKNYPQEVLEYIVKITKDIVCNMPRIITKISQLENAKKIVKKYPHKNPMTITDLKNSPTNNENTITCCANTNENIIGIDDDIDDYYQYDDAFDQYHNKYF